MPIAIAISIIIVTGKRLGHDLPSFCVSLDGEEQRSDINDG